MRFDLWTLDGWVSAFLAFLALSAGLLLWTHRRARESGRREAVEKRRGQEIGEFKAALSGVRTEMREGFAKVERDIKHVHQRIDQHLDRS